MKSVTHRKLILCFSALVLLTMIVSFPDSNCSGEDEIYKNRTYKGKIIKSRAMRGYSNEGTAIYNYQEINSYDDSLSDEELGNIKVERGSRVREVNNFIKINDDVKSEKDALDIGKISVEDGGSVRKIDNTITIDGDIEASGDSMEIGTVRSGRRTRLDDVENRVEVDGEINAK